MKNFRQLILRDLVDNSIDLLLDGDKVCLWIHDTEDKNLSNYSYAEYGDFLKALFIANYLSGCFKIEHYEYVEGTEKIGYYKAWIMKLFGEITDARIFEKLVKEVSCLAIKEFSKYSNKDQLENDASELWQCEIWGLSDQLNEKDLWLDSDCPAPDLCKAVKLRKLLYHAVYEEEDEEREFITKEIDRICPEFPKEEYFSGPNISF